MNHWWVNHKQTSKAELKGGYIWSPTKNKDNSFNQGYKNLTVSQVGDIIFSYANGLIKAIGIVQSHFEPADVPLEFGAKSNQWHKNGYLVKIRWEMLDTPFRPKEYINQIKNLLPTKYSPLRDTGDGNQGIYLAAITEALSDQLIALINQKNDYVKPDIEDTIKEVEEEEEQEIIESSNMAPREKEQLIKARRGQGKFRSHVQKIEKSCRITKINDLKFLTASHIKPWSKSNNLEKLDGNNGLMLSPHIDRLFDQGWISFEDNGDVLLAKDLPKSIFDLWGINVRNVGEFNQKQRIYLAYHRSNRFRDYKLIHSFKI